MISSTNDKEPLNLSQSVTGHAKSRANEERAHERGHAHDMADDVTDFLARRVKNIRKLLALADFQGQFALKFHVRVDRFDLELDLLN